ncbi:MAG: hypothetical protein JWP01_3117 [Myxococcales bacterium]|nr:hypothetical protein [Myxococcales bacterium]
MESPDEAGQGEPAGAPPVPAASSPAPAARIPRGLQILPALLLVVIAVWEIVATRHDATSVPDDTSWARAADLVRAGYRPGDLIVFAPEWIDPVGRLHLGDLIPIDAAARMDAARFPRIWEVAIRDARAADTTGLTPAGTEDRDGIAIRWYDQTPAKVLADLRDRLSTVRTDGGSTPILELAEVGFRPHRCVQVAPGAKGAIRLTFPGVPLGSQLVGYVGIADVFTRRDNRAPATLDIEIGGRVVASATAGVDDGWVRFAATTTPGPADVTVIARSAMGARLICFAAEARQ